MKSTAAKLIYILISLTFTLAQDLDSSKSNPELDNLIENKREEGVDRHENYIWIPTTDGDTKTTVNTYESANEDDFGSGTVITQPISAIETPISNERTTEGNLADSIQYSYDDQDGPINKLGSGSGSVGVGVDAGGGANSAGHDGGASVGVGVGAYGANTAGHNGGASVGVGVGVNGANNGANTGTTALPGAGGAGVGVGVNGANTAGHNGGASVGVGVGVNGANNGMNNGVNTAALPGEGSVGVGVGINGANTAGHNGGASVGVGVGVSGANHGANTGTALPGVGGVGVGVGVNGQNGGGSRTAANGAASVGVGVGVTGVGNQGGLMLTIPNMQTAAAATQGNGAVSVGVANTVNVGGIPGAAQTNGATALTINAPPVATMTGVDQAAGNDMQPSTASGFTALTTNAPPVATTPGVGQAAGNGIPPTAANGLTALTINAPPVATAPGVVRGPDGGYTSYFSSFTTHIIGNPSVSWDTQGRVFQPVTVTETVTAGSFPIAYQNMAYFTQCNLSPLFSAINQIPAGCIQRVFVAPLMQGHPVTPVAGCSMLQVFTELQNLRQSCTPTGVTITNIVNGFTSTIALPPLTPLTTTLTTFGTTKITSV